MDQHVPNNEVYIPNEIGRGVSSALRSPFHSIHPFIRPFLRSLFHPSIRPSMYSFIVSVVIFCEYVFIENDSHFVFGLSPGGYRVQWRCDAHAMVDTMTDMHKRTDGNVHNAENSYA